MLILGLDTSTPHLSLALWDGEMVVAELTSLPERRLAEVILPSLEKMLDQAGLQPAALTGVAVGLGPGSFTSLRVGVAAAQGLAQALQVGVAGISSFQALAADHAVATAVAVVADAQRGQLYAALYAREEQGWAARLAETLIEPPALAELLQHGDYVLCGPGAGTFQATLAAASARPLALCEKTGHFPRAAVIARICGPQLAAGGAAPADLQPLYLRRTQAEETRAAALRRAQASTPDPQQVRE